MRLDELPTSDRIEDRRGRLPGGRAGLGIGTVVILGLLAWALGIDPRVLIGGAESQRAQGTYRGRVRSRGHADRCTVVGHHLERDGASLRTGSLSPAFALKIRRHCQMSYSRSYSSLLQFS